MPFKGIPPPAGGVKALIHYKQPLGALKGSELCATKRPLRYAFGVNPALADIILSRCLWTS